MLALELDERLRTADGACCGRVALEYTDGVTISMLPCIRRYEALLDKNLGGKMGRHATQPMWGMSIRLITSWDGRGWTVLLSC